MNSDRFARLKERLLAAMDLPESDRSAFLHEACQDDPQMRREIEAMLADDQGATEILKSGFNPAQALRGDTQPAIRGPNQAHARGSVRRSEKPHQIVPRNIGRYPIIREIGRGGMGVVYLAEDSTLERIVAIKVLPAEIADIPMRLQRFEREAKLLASVSHPNIAAIHSLERDEGGAMFLVLEHVDGQTLRERLDDGPLPWRDALTLSLQVVAALEAAHARGVVHRDLKPANVLITSDEVVKLIDFGIGRREGDRGDDPALTRQGEMMGTPGYMSPEQVRGEAIDHCTDIFTFGCMVYECLCGKKAFGGDTVVARVAAILGAEVDWSALPADTPPVVRSLLERCLAKDRAARLQNIAEVRLELEALLFPANSGLPHVGFSSPPPEAGPRHNLPRRRTSFVGREAAVSEVRTLLDRSSLLTVTGAGGCGKTRLALRVAEESLSMFPGGVWLVELAGIADPQLIEPQVAAALGVGEEKAGAIPLRTLLVHRLTVSPTLLVLDNCEHLLQVVADLTTALLDSCADLRILATSREALGVPGEVTWRLPSLGEPESVLLFEERARAVVPSFRVGAENAEMVARICHRLDGIPLAIELAAAKVRVLACAEIESKLSGRFRLLAGGGRGAMERQRTLRGAIDWSYELLDGEEQRLFRGLSVFAGGWTLEGAVAVCGEGRDELEVLDLLARLADKSLVQVEEHHGATRYGYLETIRQYAREELDRKGESATLLDRHLEFFVVKGEEAKQHLELESDEDPEIWEMRLLPERENLLAAFQWCEHAEGGVEMGMRLSQAVRNFFWHRDEWTVLQETDAALLRLGGRSSSRTRASFLLNVSWFRQFTDLPGACVILRETVDQCRELGDLPLLARALRALAQMLAAAESLAVAEPLFNESVQICRTIGDRIEEARGLKALGDQLNEVERSAEADSLSADVERIYRELGCEDELAYLQLASGRAAQTVKEDSQTACRIYREGLAAIHRTDREGAIRRGTLLAELGWSVMEAGQFNEARERLEEALCQLPEHNRLGYEWWLLYRLAWVALREGDLVRARGDGLRALTASKRSPFAVHTMFSVQFLSEVSAAEGRVDAAWTLGEEALARARAVGHRLREMDALRNLSMLAGRRGDHDEAIRLSAQAVDLARAMGNPGELRAGLTNHGLALAAGGDRTAACRAFLDAIRFLPPHRLLPLMEMLEASAEMAALFDEPERAAEAWGTAQAIRERRDRPLSPHARLLREKAWSRVREALGSERFEAVHEAGRLLRPHAAQSGLEAWLEVRARAVAPESDPDITDA